jgi:hypothetical protein
MIITIFGVPIEVVILGCCLVGFAALCLAVWRLVNAVWRLVNQVDALTLRVTVNEHVTGELVAQRVHEVTTQNCRDLNEVGRS